MELQEAAAGQRLAEHAEPFEDRHAPAEPCRLVAGWQRHLAARAHDEAARKAVVERVLERDVDVAHATAPRTANVLVKRERDVDLVLGAPPEAMLVEELRLDGHFRRARDRDGEDRLVFGKGLFGEERARKIQVAARPARLGAESAEVADDGVDFGLRQGVAERRHAPVERADPAALVDDGPPVEVGLRRA